MFVLLARRRLRLVDPPPHSQNEIPEEPSTGRQRALTRDAESRIESRQSVRASKGESGRASNRCMRVRRKIFAHIQMFWMEDKRNIKEDPPASPTPPPRHRRSQWESGRGGSSSSSGKRRGGKRQLRQVYDEASRLLKTTTTTTHFGIPIDGMILWKSPPMSSCRGTVRERLATASIRHRYCCL